MQLQVSNNKATSGSQVSHKYIIRMSEVNNDKVTNGYCESKVVPQWIRRQYGCFNAIFYDFSKFWEICKIMIL